jgi:eukaryotic-like serine/threonine-protein kinase
MEAEQEVVEPAPIETDAPVEEVAPDPETSPEESPDLSVMLRGRCAIFPDQPLPQYSSKHAVAFHATMRSDPMRPLFALLCEPEMPARVDFMESMRSYQLHGVLKSADWGMVDWPGESRRRFVVVLDRPGGTRVMPSLDTPQTPFSEDELVTGLVQPLLPSLKELAGRGIAHRAIRPDNLFFTDGGRRTMVLGEGVSTPPAYDQPAVFETIECAMCDPIGRGEGTQANDVYAFGVTLLFLLLGRNPVANTDDAEVLSNKIEFGSYSALVGSYRVPLGLMEALRGMLSDDVKDRWTIADLDMWMSGRRLSPKQAKLPQRSSRPFTFEEVEYSNVRSLAHAFVTHYQEAGNVLRGKALDSWLRRSLGDEARANALQAAVSSTAAAIATGAKGGEDRVVARGCIALDPLSPIRYRGFGVAVDGIGWALAATISDRDRRQLVAEVISSRLPIHWVASQAKPKAEDLRAVQVLEKLPGMIDQVGIGYGVERCLYELNPSHRCLSPMFERAHITSIQQVLPALEVVAQRQDRTDTPIDRHLIAFIAARAQRPVEEMLSGLATHDAAARNLALLRLFAAVEEQQETVAPVPNLAKWIAGLLEPVVNGFHHRRRRDKMGQLVQAIAEQGILSELLKVLADDKEKTADQKGFSAAAAEYRDLEQQIRDIEGGYEIRMDDARMLGEQIAAAGGGLLVSIATAFAVFATFA